MAEITNSRLVSGYDGCMSISCMAENLTTGNSAMFKIKVSVPDKGQSLTIASLSSRVRDTGYITNCSGNGATLLRGETQYNEKSMDMTFADDYNLLQDVDTKVSRNTLISIIEGRTFEFNGDIWAVLGSNGVRNISNVNKRTNDRDHKFMFLKDGETFIPDMVDENGIPATEQNPYVGAYKDNNLVVFEGIYSYSDSEIKGSRVVYLMSGDIEFSEGSGTDPNKYSVPAMRYSDCRDISKYLCYGNSNPQTPQTSGTDELFRINADIIVELEPATIGDLTVAGTAGDVAVVVRKDTGIVEIYVYGADWTTLPITSTLGAGCRIFSSSYDTALDGASAVTKSCFVAIKTAGTTGNAVAVNTKTNPTGGSGSDGFVWDYYEWSYSNQTFELIDPTL